MSVKTVTVNITSHPLSREENGVVFNVKKGNYILDSLEILSGSWTCPVSPKVDGLWDGKAARKAPTIRAW